MTGDINISMPSFVRWIHAFDDGLTWGWRGRVRPRIPSVATDKREQRRWRRHKEKREFIAGGIKG